MFMLATTIVTLFIILAAIHVYWAVGGVRGKMSAIPSVNGFPAFRPSPGATFLVAVFLCLCAILVAAASGLIPIHPSRALTRWLMYFLSLGLMLRAIGDFRLVGFFKRVRGSRFAALDSIIFSPSCLVLAIAIFVIEFWGGVN